MAWHKPGRANVLGRTSIRFFFFFSDGHILSKRDWGLDQICNRDFLGGVCFRSGKRIRVRARMSIPGLGMDFVWVCLVGLQKSTRRCDRIESRAGSNDDDVWSLHL